MISIKQLAVAGLCVIALVVIVMYQNTCSVGYKSNVITIGVASGYAPWATCNEVGELEGFDVDVAFELAQRLGMPLQLVDMSPEMLMASVRAKKIDCMVAPMAITPEREKAYRMIYYQGSKAALWPVMVLAHEQISYADIKEIVIQKQVLGVLSGTKQSEYALSVAGLDVHMYDSMAYILMALRTHKITCALIDPDLGQQLLHDNPDMRCILISVPEIYQSQGNGIAVHKDNIQLADQIDSVIHAMQAEGFIAQAEIKWRIGRLV